MAGSGEIDPIFRSALSARPDTLKHLGQLAEALGMTLEDALDALSSAGIAARDGERLSILDPTEGISARLVGQLTEQRRGLDTAISLLEALPGIVELWREGRGLDGGPAFDVIDNHEDVWARWWQDSFRVTPSRPGVMVPDSVMLREQVVRDIDRVKEDFIARDFHMRVLISLRELDPESGIDTSYIPVLIDAGVEIRAIADPPSWFYVDEGKAGVGIGGIPLVWGQGNPAGMVVVYDASLIAMMSWLYDFMWARAIPVGATEQGWEPVLRLLAQGLSDKQVADALGWGLRTVRRRISEAMDELDAPTRFELGAAWASRQR
ncbi:hypothetical protein M2152_000482 [Microbacteriaceae bacterium SG_E_30_P1]|uniref:HTH luxR-type domain-containing protein n=1 Tax=Antiquaquibacter oligotrophicus TaxID=2880260 RepID=A0ABT6KJX0_9MICO|nr:helix-turn-helix transcriptional regulator [Antiquaquibacter oligotrophicus]MDH6180300.1 hypothetical protein [Antiquaquibacter oligotrophicus]UDF13953.1 helix-turn-helix transcriptional regulator [Antiquaquibacter oligotrophicus]